MTDINSPIVVQAAPRHGGKNEGAGRRALAMARHALREDGSGDQMEYDQRAAKLAGTTDRTIRDARVVLANGTAAEIAKVESGKLSIKEAAKIVRKRKPPEGPGTGPRLPIPVGHASLSAAARAGTELERAGKPMADVLKASGLTYTTYRMARDIVLLQDKELSDRDKKIVQNAVHELDTARTVSKPADMVRPIALKVWGQKGHRYKSDKARIEAISNSISFAVTTCTALGVVEVPSLGASQRSELLDNLDEAIESLWDVKRRIKQGG